MLPPIPLLPRWETLHPLVVHLPLGAAVIALILYGTAWMRGSGRCTFAADIVTLIEALSLGLATVTGLIANAVVQWPGDIRVWRTVHLAAGVTATVLVSTFATFRLRSRRPEAMKSRTFAANLVTFGLLVVTGWIGGEILVYRAGVAVEAAGHGVLAPQLRAPRQPPASLLEAMQRVRPAWAALNDELANMLVEQPSDEGFQVVARHAATLAYWFEWMAQNERLLPDPSPHLEGLYRDIATAGISIRNAADGHDLVTVATRAGEITDACVSCHARFRWPAEIPPGTLAGTNHRAEATE